MAYWRMPLDTDDHQVVIGEVHIPGYRCKGCNYCIEFCPSQVLEESLEFNEKGYYPPRVKEAGKCVNCSFCETICPEFAIYVTVAERRKPAPGDVIPDLSVGPGQAMTRRRRRAARVVESSNNHGS